MSKFHPNYFLSECDKFINKLLLKPFNEIKVSLLIEEIILAGFVLMLLD